MGGTPYFVLRQGGGRIFVISLHFTTKKHPCLHYHNHCTPTHPASTAGSCEVLDCWWRHVVGVHRHRMHITKQWTEVRRVQQPAAKVHHRNSSAQAVVHVVVEGKECWTCSQRNIESLLVLLVRNNTITCKVKDSGSVLTFQEKDSKFHACG